MAKVKGNQGKVLIGGNVVASVMRFTIDEDAELIPDTDLDETVQSFEIGDTSWTVELECKWDKADATGQGAMTIGAEVTVSLNPEGNTSGDETRSGSALVIKRGAINEKQSMVMQNFSLQGKGALTYGAVA